MRANNNGHVNRKKRVAGTGGRWAAVAALATTGEPMVEIL
jgi:hypothetical protein